MIFRNTALAFAVSTALTVQTNAFMISSAPTRSLRPNERWCDGHYQGYMTMSTSLHSTIIPSEEFFDEKLLEPAAEIVTEVPLTSPPALRKNKRRPIPAWGEAINERLQMPLITQADKYHLHAISATVWGTGLYGMLFLAWFQEFHSGNWGLVSHASIGHWILMFSGTTMLATGTTMLPNEKKFGTYSGQMRTAMSSCAALIAMSATFLIQDEAAPLMAVTVLTKLVASISLAYTIYEGGTNGRPWHILPIMQELKLLKGNPSAFLHPSIIVASYGLSMTWYSLSALCVAHGILGGAGSLTDFSGPLESAFAAQMALSLACGPTSDALVGGTLMKNEVFLKTNENRVFLMEDPEVGLRPTRLLETFQLLSVFGPIIVTCGAAAVCGHSELVSEFFYVDAFKEILSMNPFA